MKKTLLFHDTFLMKWGAERMNIEIAKILDADIATAYWSPNCYDPASMDFHGKILETNPSFQRGMIGFLRMKFSFLTSKKITDEYDTILFSNEASTAIWRTKKDAKTYYYAHSISRHLFDLYDEYLAKVPRYAKVPYIIMAWILRKAYIAELRKPSVIFVNSAKNRNRIREWIGRDDAVILFPPVDTEHFSPEKTHDIFSETNADAKLSEEGFFLSFSRLTHAKRVDEIIEAFKALPNQNLVILFGTEDSQREEFMRLGGAIPTSEQNVWIMSEKYPNIFFYSLRNNNDLPHFIREADATIAVSKNEDFGMIAIESNACGTPVIAVEEWWYCETITNGENGIFLEKDIPIPSAVQKLVENTPRETWQNLGKKSVKYAEKYSLENFRKKFEAHIGK